MEPIITLSFAPQEVNAVLSALGQLPYNQVEQIINKIRQQVFQQVQVAEPTPDIKPDES